jgi:S-adenosylmethionine hydrolase
MADLVTLTTDFGEDSPYVAALKGALLQVNPKARIQDLSHHIPPQDLRYTAFFLSTALPFFPPGVIHVVVVDPGVGTDRAVLLVELAGQRLVLPDNGCWTALADRIPDQPVVRRLTEPRYWRHPVSATFHGRDIMGPVAGHLSAGVNPQRLGEPTNNWMHLDLPRPRIDKSTLTGEILFIDHFGNLITNFTGDDLIPFASDGWQCQLGRRSWRRIPCIYSYGKAPEGSLVAILGSSGYLEFAVTNGNAARLLKLQSGARVVIKK